MKSNLVLTVVGLFCGCVIMGTSLVQASEVYSPNKISSTSQQINIDDPVVPGHLFYPISVVSNRARVILSSEADRPFLQLQIAQLRLQDSVTLIEMEKTGVATQTLWKGHHYLELLMADYHNEEMPAELRSQLVQMLIDYRQVVSEYKNFFTDNQKATLDELLAKNEVLSQELSL